MRYGTRSTYSMSEGVAPSGIVLSTGAAKRRKVSDIFFLLSFFMVFRTSALSLRRASADRLRRLESTHFTTARAPRAPSHRPRRRPRSRFSCLSVRGRGPFASLTEDEDDCVPSAHPLFTRRTAWVMVAALRGIPWTHWLAGSSEAQASPRESQG